MPRDIPAADDEPPATYTDDVVGEVELPEVAEDLPRDYPLPQPEDDSRFTFGLTVEVADVLEAGGYPRIREGADLLELRQALFCFLYEKPADPT